MSNKPGITAIICNFNGGRYLNEAINSVLNQDLLPDEFIVVDDKSSDNSVEIIREVEKLNKDRLTFISHSKNRGQAAGMNTAVSASSGEVLAFLDSDDIWYPGKLSAVRDAYIANPKFGLFQHNLEIIVDGVNTGEPYLSAMTLGDAFDIWRKYNTFPRFSPTSGLAVRREVFNEIGAIPEELTISADSYLTRTSICLGPVVSIFESLGGYRDHSDNNVYGNSEHDAGMYFHNNVSPLLNDFYKSQGIISSKDKWPGRPFFSGKSFIDKLLDVSPRKVIGHFTR